MGTVEKDLVVTTRLEAFEYQLAQVTQLLMGRSSSMNGQFISVIQLRGLQFPIQVTLELKRWFLGV